MAMDLGKETLSISKEERTWRVEIFCEKSTDPVFKAYREILITDTDGTIVSQDRNVPSVIRNLSSIASQKFTVNDKIYTGVEMAAVIAAVVDVLREEDKQNIK